jgi:hypothetical protein
MGQRADEPINLMILEALSELSPTIEQLIHTIQYAERPCTWRERAWINEFLARAIKLSISPLA